jgi:putative hydrolase of the HAD superfamily
MGHWFFSSYSSFVSNCFSEEAEVIRESVLFPYFDAVCLSYEEGVMKPDIEIYHRCVSKLGVRLEECMYVGDGGSHELEIARALNMIPVQAVWYLKDVANHPRKRMPEFMQLETPMQVTEYVVERNKKVTNI